MSFSRDYKQQPMDSTTDQEEIPYNKRRHQEDNTFPQKKMRTEDKKSISETTQQPQLEMKTAKLTNSEFIKLLYNEPQQTLKLLKQNPKLIEEITQDESSPFGSMGNIAILAGEFMSKWWLGGLDKEKDNDFAACLSILFENDWFYSCLFKSPGTIAAIPCIQHDMPHTSFCLYAYQLHYSHESFVDTSKKEFFEKIFEYDSVLSFVHITHLSGVINQHPRLKLLPASELLALASKHKAAKCISYLKSTSNFSKEEIASVATDAANEGYAETLLAIYDGDMTKAAEYIFSNILHFLNNKDALDKALNECLTKVLRFTPLETTNYLIDAFIESHQFHNNNILLEAIKKTKDNFLRFAPFISLHTKPLDLEAIDKAYRNKEKKHLQNDIEYGNFCRTQVEKLVHELKKQSEQKISPAFNGFLDSYYMKTLPPSKTGTRRVAVLLEKIAEIRADKQTTRSPDTESKILKKFQSLRIYGGVTTPIIERYSWALPLVNDICLYYKADDISTDFKDFNGYKFFYNNEVITSAYSRATGDYVPQPPIHWDHGMQSVTTTWAAIEDAFEMILAMDLSEATLTSLSDEQYKNTWKNYFSKVAELAWLIGNTTPLSRGSGTIAEWLLAIVHLYHGFEPPVLKKQFPQLDVLDISFPLSLYKNCFRYFFETESLCRRSELRLENSLMAKDFKESASVSNNGLFKVNNNTSPSTDLAHRIDIRPM